jgi:ABC-type branched-subunit amino acid transport system ATPase component
VKPVLSVRGLDKRFGAVVAADALSIDIAAGQKVSLIGANGAGKTTFVSSPTLGRSHSTESISEGARQDMLRGSAYPGRFRFRNCSLSSQRPKI